MAAPRGETLCDLLVGSDAPIVVDGAVAARDELVAAAQRYARGFAEQGYPYESRVLVSLERPEHALEVVFGAWWAGLAVCVAEPFDPYQRDAVAFSSGAALQVCDAERIFDEEHIRHRDVPALPPSELRMMAAAWPPRCRSESPACFALDDSPEDQSHAELVGELRACAERGQAPELDEVMPPPLAESLVDLVIPEVGR